MIVRVGRRIRKREMLEEERGEKAVVKRERRTQSW